MTRVAVAPGGRIRALFDGPLDFRRLGCLPTRASRVEVVEEPGPARGLFYVDMSLLGEDHQVCLWPPRASHADAVADERLYIEKHWIKGGAP
jgi:hypothetical protein